MSILDKNSADYAPDSFLTTEVMLEVDGVQVTKTAMEWCQERGIPFKRAYKRRGANATWEETFSPENLHRRNVNRIRDTTWNGRQRAVAARTNGARQH